MFVNTIMKISHLFENNIVWNKGDYSVKLDDLEDPRYVSLFYNDTKVGDMSTRHIPGYRNFLSPNDIQIDKDHRGNGLAYWMFKILFDNLSNKYDGLIFHRPEITNKVQIPKVLERLGVEVLDDDHFVLRR
jgi:hypothetical protein